MIDTDSRRQLAAARGAQNMYLNAFGGIQIGPKNDDLLTAIETIDDALGVLMCSLLNESSCACFESGII